MGRRRARLGALRAAALLAGLLPAGRRSDDDARNRQLLERVNATGEIFVSHAALDGRYVLRLAVGQMSTTESDVRRAWDVLRATAQSLD